MEHHHHGPQLAELLDLDAEVLHAYLADVTAWVREQAAGQPGRVLDLGAGTGTGTVALARAFAGASVTAVDRSADMLARVRSRAAGLGLAGRVATVQADLDAGWPASELSSEPADLAWASNVLHELPRPELFLAGAFAAIRPGGLLAVAELGAPPRFLPDDIGLGRPGLEARCHAALESAPERPPTPHGADWAPALERAGFAPVTRRTFPIDLKPPQPPAVARYARAYLQHIRPALDGRLDATDLATLDMLIEPGAPASLLRRGDLTVRATRTAWTARRPPQ
jgi:SAM-dependent methyltransferase